MAWEFCGYLIKEINAINSQELITYTLMYIPKGCTGCDLVIIS